MSAKKKTKLSKTAKKPTAKKIRAKLKKEISAPISEAFKEWKDSQRVTLSLSEVETILDDTFNAVDNIWIENLTQLITKLDSISSEMRKIADEHERGDIQTKYTEYDIIKETIIHKCSWKE